MRCTWWSVQRVAAFLNVSERTVRTMLTNGAIPRRRAGRAPILCHDLVGLQRKVTVTPESIEQFLENQS